MQILELPYQDRDLCLLVLLPRGKTTLAELQKKLTLDQLTAVTSGLNRREVDVVLPRFKVIAELVLTSDLKDLGLVQAFTPQAELTDLLADKPTYLSNVLQLVSFEVDEGIGPQSSLPNPIPERQLGSSTATKVRADHPFLFVLKDASRGGIVFIGRISSDPSKSDPVIKK